LPKLRDYFESDLAAMINNDEFAEEHNISGKIMSIVPDNELLKVRQAKLNQPEGIYTSTICFHVQASVFGTKPVPDIGLTYDSEPYTITDVQEDAGEYIITLGKYGS
jgi:hypothetical protein